MGVVFTPEQFAAGRIPKPDDYPRAYDLVRFGLNELLREGKIIGAVFNGSTGAGPVRPGSDIDVVLVVPDRSACRSLESLANSIENHTNVPIEFVPEVASLARQGMHGIDYFYAQSLAAQRSDMVIGENPADYFTSLPAWSNPREERLRETRDKIRRQTKAIVNTRRWDAERCHALQRGLAWPVIMALDRIRVADGHNNLDAANQMPSKRRILEMYEDRHGSTPVLCEAIALTDNYREFLASSTNIIKYEKLLFTIDSFLDTSIAFLHKVHDEIRDEAR